MPERDPGAPKAHPMTSAEIRRLAGPVTDNTVLAILECGASAEELEIALTYLRGNGSVVDRLGHAMTGTVSQLCDILSSDELYAEPDE
ncbi:MAG: hypothetical protein ACK4TL_14295 [Hyphomicrobiaceae bacterium]